MIGADGDTGPAPLLLDSSLEELKRVTAPYPKPPANAKIAKFCSTAVDDDGLGDDDDDDIIRW